MFTPVSPRAVKPKRQRLWASENYGRGKHPEAMTKLRKRELAALEAQKTTDAGGGSDEGA